MFFIVTERHDFLWQLKNAESILEYERMAEIGFDKRDFRMVSSSVFYTLSSFCYVCVPWCVKQLLLLFLGGVLHGPGPGVRLRLPQVQDTEGRVLSAAGTLP